jgi:hypothetical protein
MRACHCTHRTPDPPRARDWSSLRCWKWASQSSVRLACPHFPAVAVPTHLFKVVLAEGSAEGSAASNRRLSAFVVPNGPLAGHPDIDDFTVPLARVERASGLELFADLGADRYTIPPLCGGDGGGGAGGRCGAGCPLDGRIIGWKLLGDLKRAASCKELEEAWTSVEAKGRKLDNMSLMAKTRSDKAGSLACPMPAPPHAPTPPRQPEVGAAAAAA